MPPVFHLEFRVLVLPWEEKSRLVGFSERIYCNLCVKKLVGVGMIGMMRMMWMTQLQA